MTYQHTELFPLSEDQTAYRLLSSDYVSTTSFDGHEMTVIQSEALQILSEQAFIDINHLLRPGPLISVKEYTGRSRIHIK